MSGKKVLQLTLAILKPDITPFPYAVAKIRDLILEKGFLVVERRELKMDVAMAERFYQEHQG